MSKNYWEAEPDVKQPPPDDPAREEPEWEVLNERTVKWDKEQTAHLRDRLAATKNVESLIQESLKRMESASCTYCRKNIVGLHSAKLQFCSDECVFEYAMNLPVAELSNIESISFIPK